MPNAKKFPQLPRRGLPERCQPRNMLASAARFLGGGTIRRETSQLRSRARIFRMATSPGAWISRGQSSDWCEATRTVCPPAFPQVFRTLEKTPSAVSAFRRPLPIPSGAPRWIGQSNTSCRDNGGTPSPFPANSGVSLNRRETAISYGSVTPCRRARKPARPSRRSHHSSRAARDTRRTPK